MTSPLASIVIPVWRDRDDLADLLPRLGATGEVEIVVATALDEQHRYADLREAFPGVRWAAAPRGRGSQMNAGATRAAGRWLLFLHADSRLDSSWLDVIRTADADPGVVAGSFRLTLASSDRRARLVETGVRLRVALLGLSYGDQALFVRRTTFDSLGGYRDLPIMEDIDLVLRLRRTGRCLQSRVPVRTSARRWERDGWARRSGENLLLAALFLCGVPPARLARVYSGRKRHAIALMARAPWVAGKTRLRADLSAGAHEQLRWALFADTLDVVAGIRAVEHLVLCSPADACDRLESLVPVRFHVLAQRDGDLGERLAGAFDDILRLGVEAAVVIGSDVPSLPARVLARALAALRQRGDRVVLGPAEDGGYYLIGLKRLHSELFEGMDWSSPRVLEQTRARAAAHGLEVELLEPWYDVDEWRDLVRLRSEPPGVALRTRAWLGAPRGLERH